VGGEHFDLGRGGEFLDLEVGPEFGSDFFHPIHGEVGEDFVLGFVLDDEGREVGAGREAGFGFEGGEFLEVIEEDDLVVGAHVVGVDGEGFVVGGFGAGFLAGLEIELSESGGGFGPPFGGFVGVEVALFGLGELASVAEDFAGFEEGDGVDHVSGGAADADGVELLLHAFFVGEEVVGGGEPTAGFGEAGVLGGGLEERCDGFFGEAFLEEEASFVGVDFGEVAAPPRVGDLIELVAGVFEVVLLDGEIDGEEAGAESVGVEVKDFGDGLGAVVGVVGVEEDACLDEFGGPVGFIVSFDLAELEEDGAVLFAADAGEEGVAFEGEGELRGDLGIVGEVSFGEWEEFGVDSGGGGVFGIVFEGLGVGGVEGDDVAPSPPPHPTGIERFE